MDLPEPTPIEFNVNGFLEIASLYEPSETEILSYISVYSSNESLEEHLDLELAQYKGEKYSVYDGLQYNHINSDEIQKVINKYGDAVYRMVLIQGKNTEAADAIYQSVFLKLVKNKMQVPFGETVKRWLLKDYSEDEILKVQKKKANFAYGYGKAKRNTGFDGGGMLFCKLTH